MRSAKQNKGAQRKQQKKTVTNPRQIGAAFATRMPRIGFSDIKSHKMSWIAGYVFIGDGTNGAVDNVLLQTAAGTYLMGSTATTFRGAIPLIGADSQVGAAYIGDVEKHYARKVVKSMKVTVASLQPATSNNMMCVVAVSRGQGLAEQSFATPLATATTVQQAFTNVMSMDGAVTVDAWETKTFDITRFIAGGSGAKQNEFELANNVSTTTVLTASNVPAQDLDGIVPCALTISGNSTGSALRNTRTHAIIIEQVVDLLDYLGGTSPIYSVGVSSSTSNTMPPAPTGVDEARDLARRLLALTD